MQDEILCDSCCLFGTCHRSDGYAINCALYRPFEKPPKLRVYCRPSPSCTDCVDFLGCQEGCRGSACADFRPSEEYKMRSYDALCQRIENLEDRVERLERIVLGDRKKLRKPALSGPSFMHEGENMKEEIIGRFDSIDDLAIWLRAYRGYRTLRQYGNGSILTSDENGDAIIDRNAECVAFPCEVDEEDLESCDAAESIQVLSGYFWFNYKDLAVCNSQLCVIMTTGQYAEEAE